MEVCQYNLHNLEFRENSASFFSSTSSALVKHVINNQITKFIYKYNKDNYYDFINLIHMKE